MIDETKTLEELEGLDWGEPIFDLPIYHQIYGLRKKPLKSLTTGELRLLIGQQVGLPFLVPKALLLLEENPLINTQYYEGDLLENVLLANGKFLLEHEDFVPRTRAVAENALSKLPLAPQSVYEHINEVLIERISRYLSCWKA